MKVKSFTQQILQPHLPDGTYKGKWSGYEIKLEAHGSLYVLYTEDGIRGMDIPVIVTVKDENITFEQD